MKRQITLIIDDVRSVHNVGSLFRTADAAGVSEIVLVGHTPGPLDRFGRSRRDFAKVALGAEKSIPWKEMEKEEALSFIRAEGYALVALEQSARSISYRDYRASEKVALIVGSETEGVHPLWLENADAIIEIPMHGKKESLNVSVAGGIALFSLVD